MNNLTKENFFNEIKIKYPAAMESFCKWIDEYKQKNNWGQLFLTGIKYHNIPLEMQIGLWMFFTIKYLYSDEIKGDILFHSKQNIEKDLKEIEETLKNKKP